MAYRVDGNLVWLSGGNGLWRRDVGLMQGGEVGATEFSEVFSVLRAKDSDFEESVVEG